MAFSYSSAINNLVAGAAENIADVVTCLNDVKAVLNNGITGTDHLSASAGVADTQLVAPNNGVYRQIHNVAGSVGAGAAGNTYFFQEGTMVTDGAGTSPASINTFQLVAADYTVAGKTTKLRVRGQVGCNATAPGINFTFWLFPVTVAGGANSITITAGVQVVGSSAVVAVPGASAFSTTAGSDVTFPANGAYALGVTTSGAIAANSLANVVATLEMRHV